MIIQLPYRLGKYQLIRQIGEGASGSVYYAKDMYLGRDVAVKVFDKGVIGDSQLSEDLRQQFLNEASLVGRLEHPHIVAILNASVTDDGGYVVMEYVPEGNLDRYTDPESLLPIGDVLQIIFKCCGALDYAFRHGIIHRDIKPANIMIMSGTNIKIADFGAAVFHQAQTTQTQNISSVTVGTPYYMSPEQISGCRLAHFSDMYSLGIVAYELLTGVLPFKARDIQELFDTISNKPAPPPSVHRPELSGEIDRVILRMIAKSPNDRYPNWADLALDIAEIGRFGESQQDVPDSTKFNMLRSGNALKNFSDPELWELIMASTWAKFPAKAQVLLEGEVGDSMYFLASGQIKVMKKGRLLNVINSGEFFGEMAYVLRGTKRQATLEALNELVVAVFPFAVLDKLSMGCELRLTKTILHSMTERLALAGERIARQGS